MKIETIINGQVTLIIIPENPMDEAILKQLSIQENTITKVGSGLPVLGKTIPPGSLIISKPTKEPEHTGKGEGNAS